ncbi:MAG TPA: hypothetical protein VHO25_24480 [Polyangiaceae bacterium]|jgi:hypothetical protein|nr:hypothetical protein [Polyangiaceae bacterium]
MRYRFLYLQLAVLGLAQPGCLGGQTGDTTGFSDNTPLSGGHIGAGGSGSSDPNLGSGGPPNGFGGDVGLPGSAGAPGIPTNGPEAGSGGQAGSTSAGGSAGEGAGGQGGSAGDTSADGGFIEQNALTTADQGCDDERTQSATVADAGSDAATSDAATHTGDGPDCH